MSGSGYQPGNVPSPAKYSTMDATRAPAANLPDRSARSDLNSPIYPLHYQGSTATKGAGQVSPQVTSHLGMQGGMQNGPPNGLSTQLASSMGPPLQQAGGHSRSATSTPPLLPGALKDQSRPGSAPLTATLNQEPASSLYKQPTTFPGQPGVMNNSTQMAYVSTEKSPNINARYGISPVSTFPGQPRGISSMPSSSSPGGMLSSGTLPTPTQPVRLPWETSPPTGQAGIYPSGTQPQVGGLNTPLSAAIGQASISSIPSSSSPGGTLSSGPLLTQPTPTHPGRQPWETLPGQAGIYPPHSQPQVGDVKTPPVGQLVGSTGHQFLPPMSQAPPLLGQATPPSSTTTGQGPAAPISKRRVYPTQSHGGSSYPSQAYPGSTVSPSPSSNPMSSSAMQPQVPAPGMGANITGPSSNQVVNNQYGANHTSQISSQMGKLNVQQADSQPINLMERRNILPPTKEESSLSPELQKRNAKSNILCCTLNNVPENHSLLQKCKLPFGILVHPFKDLSNLPVIHSTSIVRCRSCRTYINPFVTFTEVRKWRCNMCYRINEVTDDFCYDPQTKSYGEPARRPEIKSATYEFIAPSEYMLRSPQPASYVFVFDVSFNAIETGYLKKACAILKENLDKIPSDSRALVGFVTFNKSVSFYNLRNDQSQPQMLIVSDVDDIFLPAPEDLLVNLRENKEMIIQFLDTLPETFASTRDTQCATGAAMQAALKLLSATGGRITVFQTTLPNIGPGALENREEAGVKSSPKDSIKLNPSTDFYKKLALDCSADQVSIDIFLLSAQYADLSSLLCVSKYSGGCMSFFPNFHIVKNTSMVEKFENELTRYLTRKIGFEAVMRVRCTKGLSIHTFHGNFFVRSTDLLSLPNVNPDAAFGMQISIEDDLTDTNLACFQSALLYTSSRGERRIRVHNLALPVTKKMSDVFAGANVNAIALMLSKMAVDRTLSASLGDAREALMNAVVDCLGSYKSAMSGHTGQLLAPYSLRLLPLFVLSLLKQNALRLGSTSGLDSRCYDLQQFKVLPFDVALLTIYPALYSLHDISDEGAILTKSGSVPQPQRLVLSGENLSRDGIFLMDAGQEFIIWVGRETSNNDIQCLLGVPNFASIPDDMGSLPELDNTLSNRVKLFVDHLQAERTNHCNLYILRDNSKMRMKFINKLMNDRTESMMSYHEFMIHLQGQIS